MLSLQALYLYRMTKGVLAPDYVFESSWEVCNKVGGIYRFFQQELRRFRR